MEDPSHRVADGIKLRELIDQVVDSEPLSHYDFENSSFRNIEKTVNFASKLEQINKVMTKEVFAGTLASIAPRSFSVVYKRPAKDYARVN